MPPPVLRTAATARAFPWDTLRGVPDLGDIDWDEALRSAYRIAYGVLRDREEARDVAQEACIRALTRIDTFEGRCPFPRWVASIALRVALDRARKRRPVGADPDDLPGGDDPGETAQGRQAAAALQRCLAELAERQRMIFLMRHWEGLKASEVAGALRIAEGTVYAATHQAATNLRRCLERHGIQVGVLH